MSFTLNNPGNIRHSADAWEGMSAEQPDPGFVSFDTPEAGVRAMSRILMNYQREHDLNTVEGIVSRWAPPSDDNPTDTYIKFVSDRVGVDPRAPLDLSDPQKMLSVVKAMSRFENGAELPWDDDRTLKGVYAGIGGEDPPAPVVDQKNQAELTAELAAEDRTRNPIQFGDSRPASPVTRDEQRAAKVELEKTAPSLAEGTGLAFKSEWAILQGLAGNEQYAPDADFKLTPEKLKELTEGVPEEHWGFFKDAHSEAHAEYLRGLLMNDLEAEKRLAQMGWTGLGLRLGASVLDPVAIGVGVGTEGLAAPFLAGVKLSRLARIAKFGVEGALAGGVPEALLEQTKPTHDAMDILYAAGGGAALGALVGRLGRVAPAEAERLAGVGTDLQRVAEAEKATRLGMVPESSASAMEHSYKEALHPDTFDVLKDADETVAPKATFGRVRWDSVGQLKSSENPLARAAGSLAEDAVGNADKSVSTAYGVSEWVQRMFRSTEAVWNRERKTALNEWADAQGLSTWRSSTVKQFDELVADYLRNSNPFAEYHPAIKRQGENFRRMTKQGLDLANNPGLPEGKTLRGVKGFGEGVENYVPRIADKRKLNELVTRFGDKNIRKLLTQAILDAQPDIERNLAKKFAKAWLQTQRRVAVGMEAHADNAFGGGDVDYLRTLLKEQGDMSNADIEDVLSLMSDTKGDKGAHSRARNRIRMTERFGMQMKDKTGNAHTVSVQDLLVNDSDYLFKSYMRSVLGSVGMARWQVRNPKALPDEASQFLVDGITSRGEWDTFLQKVRATGDSLGQQQTAMDRDVENLQFIYRSIMGIPHNAGSDKAAMQLLRMVRDYNFVRVMNQVGFAQLAEIGNITGQLGIKAALQNMPSFRSLIRNAKTGKFRTELLDEIESTWGFGAERLQVMAPTHWDQFGAPGTYTGESRALNTLDNLLRSGKRITTDISGFNAVNTYTHAWAASAVIGKFASDAFSDGAKLTNRLRTLGLTEDTHKAVLAELKKHATIEDGVMGQKVKRLNLDKWEGSARSTFEDAVDRWTRRIIQENDVGMMHRMFSSPYVQILTQFRMFMLGAWGKQFLHNIHMRDWETFASFTATTLAAGLAYTGQTIAQSVGRGDADKFLEKKLSPETIALNAWQRTGWSSIMPMLIDSGSLLSGNGMVFSGRTTGLPSNAIFGNPTANLFDSLRGFGEVGGALLSGRTPSQREARDLFSVLPFQNFLPIQQTFSTMISGNPQFAPR